MSSLQCPATLLLTAGGAEPADRRVAHVWAPDRVTGAPVAESWGVGLTVVAGLAADDAATLRDVLGSIADATPGETTLVVALHDGLRAALQDLARVGTTPDRLATADPLELVVDADGWVCRTPE